MIDKAAFGATGHLSSRVIFGAAALGSVSQLDADRTLELILEHGVNHVDTAASYGESELRLAPWLRENRDGVFLATKTGERVYAAAREQIRRSLDRMEVDRVDLIQLHCLVHPAEWDLALSEDGALRAAVEARDEGLVSFIGYMPDVLLPLYHGWLSREYSRAHAFQVSFTSIAARFIWAGTVS